MGGSGANDWVIGNIAPSGDFPIPAIASTTAANGWALYDSDLYCANGDNAWIQNVDPINLSGYPVVQLQFEEYYRKFNDQTFVEVSNNGTDWTSFEVNSTVAGNGSTTNPFLVTVPISSVAGNQSSVYIRFQFTSAAGCDYSWQVDDVSISAVQGDNMTLVSKALTPYDDFNTTTWDSLAYTIYPISELRPMGVNMKYTNNGATTATNVTTTISTSDGYNQSSTGGTLAPADTMAYFPSPEYTPTAVTGDHTIYYSVSADGADTDTSDNSGSLSVGVSNFVYARDAGSLEYLLRDTTTGPAFKVANGFYVNVDEMLYSIDVAFYDSSATGLELNAQLLDPNTANFDPIAESEYHTLVASELSGGGEGNFVRFFFDPPVQLTAGTDYLAAVQHFGGADVVVGASGDVPAQSSFIYRSTASEWFYLTVAPMIRMAFAEVLLGITPDDVQNGVGLGQNTPNPANELTTVNYTLENSAKVNMELHDINGKLVRILAEGTMSAGEHRVDINTSDLQNGVYFYVLTTDGAVSTKRMTVVH